MSARSLAFLLAVTAAHPVRAAEVFGPRGTPQTGRLDYVFVGASMADNTGLFNGVNCLEPSATATVRAAALPQRPRLLSATLYLGGSLIQFAHFAGAAPLFQPPDGLRADRLTDRPYIEAAAVAGAPRTVSFKPPGASAAVTVTHSGSRGPFVSVLYKPAGLEQGNLAFFLTPIDVTSVIAGAGNGVLVGDYQVSGLLADVCVGMDVMCSGTPGEPSCASNPGSALNTNGAASFALLLVIEDVSLPRRTLEVYDGMVNLTGRTVTEWLTLTTPVSAPAAGSLAIYALEGDLLLPTVPVTDGPCASDEYVEVDGDLDPTSGGLCLFDDDNPVQNLFNGTMNQEPAAPGQVVCPPGATDPWQCCSGDGLCGLVGVDIDRFNISPAVQPGSTAVRTSLHSGQDQVFLASLVLDIDVFEPVLQTDTQIRVLENDGANEVRLGGSLTYSVAVSNTGNVPATGVGITLDVPAGVGGFEVTRLPPGATDASDPSGGADGTGRLMVSGFDVAPGKIAEVRLGLTAPCAVGLSLAASARVTSNETLPFFVSAPTVVARGPGDPAGACPGADPDGPYAPREETGRALRGGGGVGAACAGVGAGPALLLGVLLALVLRRRRRAWRSGSMLVLLTLALGPGGCASRHTPEPGPVVPPRGLTSLDGLPGTTCGSKLMVVVTRADGSRFCIDRFEAGLAQAGRGGLHQGGGDDTVTTTDGSTTAPALAGLSLAPAAAVSWYQAAAACANAGKRLCAVAEWERACRGPSGLVYPYSDTYSDTACNGFFAYSGLEPAPTGSFATCGSAFGAYDLSGNLEEWTGTPVERVPGTGVLDDRAVRGGGYAANAGALACAGPEFHGPPGSALADRGFRCCRDAP